MRRIALQWGACSPKVPTLIPVQRNVLLGTASSVSLKKKNARSQGRRIIEREWGFHSEKCLYPPVRSFLQKWNKQRSKASHFSLFVYKLLPNLVCQRRPVGHPHIELCVGLGLDLGACTHTHKQTRLHRDTRTTVPSGVKSRCSTTPRPPSDLPSALVEQKKRRK